MVRVEDPILIRITELLTSRYNHFLKKTRILAAFRGYKINHIRYQVLFKKIDKQDTFNGVVDYFPETDKLKLQSLVLMDLTILSVSDQGCALMQNSNCEICSRGY